MMFTQKHYEFFAKFFGPQMNGICQSEITENLIEEFKKDSPKFDETRFHEAMRKAYDASKSESRQRGRLIYSQATYHQNDPGGQIPCGDSGCYNPNCIEALQTEIEFDKDTAKWEARI